MRCIEPHKPNALDWLAMYRDFCWIAETPETRRSFARAIVALRALGRTGRRYEVCFDHLDRHIRIAVSDVSELETIRDVFVEEDYRLEVAEPVRTVVDLGSHIGASVVWFHAVYPQARIIAVEPHPVTFRRLQHNIRGLDRIEALNVAISDQQPRRAAVRRGRELGDELVRAARMRRWPRSRADDAGLAARLARRSS